MKSLCIVFSYNRQNVLRESLRTLFENTSFRFDEYVVLDDGSDENLKKSLLQFSIDYSTKESPISIMFNGRNNGYGPNFEHAYSILKLKNPEIVAFIESDYIFRRGFMEDVNFIFENSPYCVAIPGTSHPDFFKKGNEEALFKRIMVESFQEDIVGREYYFKKFAIGNIEVQGVSNSGGCFFLNWKRFKQYVFSDLDAKLDWEAYCNKSFHKFQDEKKYVYNDGIMTSAITYYWNKWAVKNNIDLSKNFPWIDICDCSIGNHLCALGINGKLPGISEGQTFVASPTWPENYNEWKRDL